MFGRGLACSLVGWAVPTRLSLERIYMIDRKSITRWAFLCLVFLCAGNLLADGKYWPLAAYKKAPDIPGQKAVIIYKDGVEKLIIESSLEGEGKEFGWIIPLPNKPENFEIASAGFIHTLSNVVQPEINNVGFRGLIELLIVAVIITTICLFFLFSKPRYHKPKPTLVEILCVVAIIAFLLAILMPPLGLSGGMSIDFEGVVVHDVQTVGSYDLQTLEAETPDALDKWLSTNGFAVLSPDEKVVVADYIKEDWYFVASKLRRDDESGYIRPHPLAMSFKTNKPVYPFRLTALTDSDVYLELYVIADKLAQCNELTLEVSDTYNYKEKGYSNYFSSDTGRDMHSGFIAEEYPRYFGIGHPKANDYMWDDCVISRLCGTIEVGSTNDDLSIDLSASYPYRKYYYSKLGARSKAYMYSILVWCIFLSVATAIYRNKKREAGEGRKAIFQILAVALVLLSVTGLVTYSVLPKVEVNVPIISGHPVLVRGRMASSLGVESVELTDEYSELKEMSKEEVVKVLEDYHKSKDSKNMLTGEKVRYEDSPGNYTVYEDERGVVLRRYILHGYPDDWVVGTGFDK